MDYEKLMVMGYGERGLVIRVCLDRGNLNKEVRRMFRKCKDFDEELCDSEIYRTLSEVFCLSEESVERCVKGKEINCCFYTGGNNDK